MSADFQKNFAEAKNVSPAENSAAGLFSTVSRARLNFFHIPGFPTFLAAQKKIEKVASEEFSQNTDF